MAEEESQESFQDEPTPGGKNPLLTIVMILNCVLLGGIAYMQFENHKKLSSMPSIQDIIKEANKEVMSSKDGPESGEAQEVAGKLFPIEGGFTANLAQGDGPRRFVRANMVLRISDDSDENEVKQRKAQIRDSIITILNSKRPEDLLKVQGKEFLKEEIKAAINSFLVKGKIVDVYYVSFQIN